MAAAQQFPTLTFEQAKEALDEVIAAFEQPDAMAKVSAMSSVSLFGVFCNGSDEGGVV